MRGYLRFTEYGFGVPGLGAPYVETTIRASAYCSTGVGAFGKGMSSSARVHEG